MEKEFLILDDAKEFDGYALLLKIISAILLCVMNVMV